MDPKNLSEQVYGLIKRDILQGILLPEEKMQIETMSERYKIGSVPIREALNRLTAEGLVSRIKQRGFFVAPLILGDLEELVRTRIWAEQRALAESIGNGDENWEEELVLSFHRLARIGRSLEPGSELEVTEAWDARHKEFHTVLLSRCKSVWITDFCSLMMDQAVRYRNVSMNLSSSIARREGAAEEHAAILESILSKKVDMSCKLLEEHYLGTLKSLQDSVNQKA